MGFDIGLARTAYDRALADHRADPGWMSWHMDLNASVTFDPSNFEADHEKGDTVVAATHARQYATTRTALIDTLNSAQHAPMNTHQSDGDCTVCPVPLYTLSPEEISDALLSTPGPLLDAAEVWDWGKVAGKSITMRRMSDEPLAPEPENPYRSEKQ